MRQILRRTLGLVWEHWPMLAGVLTIAWVVHHFGLEWAAAVATRIPVLGWAMIPLAILLYIVGFAIAFRLLRSSLPAFDDGAPSRAPAPPPSPPAARHEGGPAGPRGVAAGLRRVSTLAAAVVLPFFVMWSAWGFFDDDLEFFSSEVNRRFIFREGGPDFRPNEVPFGWIAVAVLVLAYAAKLLSERLERRWAGFAITTVYFEVLWVFFFSVAVFAPVRDVFAWVGRSRMWSAVEAWWRTVLDGLEPLRALWDGVVAPLLAFLPTIADTLFLPLAWFALAAIVIGRPLPDEVVRREFLTRHPRLDRMVGHSGRAWKAVPRPLQAVADEFLGDLVIRASSLANAFRAMRALGIERIAGFVLLWTVLALVEAALVLGVRELVGVQDTRFWGMFFNPLLIIAWVPTQVVRVALVAATYSAALRAEASASAASPGPRRGAGRPETLSGR